MALTEGEKRNFVALLAVNLGDIGVHVRIGGCLYVMMMGPRAMSRFNERVLLYTVHFPHTFVRSPFDK